MMPGAGPRHGPAPVPAACGLARRRPGLLGGGDLPGRSAARRWARRPISGPAACDKHADGYGRWLAWLADQGGSRPRSAPAARVTRERGRRLCRRPAAGQRAAHRAGPASPILATVLGWFAPEQRLGLAPSRSWPGCEPGCARYADKRARLRSAHELLALGPAADARCRGRHSPALPLRRACPPLSRRADDRPARRPPAAAGQLRPARARPGAGAARRRLVARDPGCRDQDRRAGRAALPRGAGAGARGLSRHLAAAARPDRRYVAGEQRLVARPTAAPRSATSTPTTTSSPIPARPSASRSTRICSAMPPPPPSPSTAPTQVRIAARLWAIAASPPPNATTISPGPARPPKPGTRPSTSSPSKRTWHAHVARYFFLVVPLR